MYCLSLKEVKKRCKSGHPKMQIPIMLYLKAKGIHTAPPGNSYINLINTNYINLSFINKKHGV